LFQYEEREIMLPPKPRLLSVIEIIAQPKVETSTQMDKRYPHRRSLERATKSFVAYLLVSNLFADDAEAKPQKEIDKHPVLAPDRFR
jgi:hypothetical protein